jgi:hypothetical protein
MNSSENFIRISPYVIVNDPAGDATNKLLCRIAVARLEVERRGLQPIGLPKGKANGITSKG